MIKRKPREGSIISIHLENGLIAYGQVLNKASLVIFDSKKEEVTDLDEISRLEALFIISVYDYVYKNKNWNLLGRNEIRQDLLILPNNFIQDALNSKRFELYNPNTGEITSSTREDCFGLECAAVWEMDEIEDRIMNRFNGIVYVEEFK